VGGIDLALVRKGHDLSLQVVIEGGCEFTCSPGKEVRPADIADKERIA
jgi:hypothetical protein